MARRQRLAYKKRDLSEDRIRKLEKLGFEWDLQKSAEPDGSSDEHSSSSDESSSSEHTRQRQRSSITKSTSSSKAKRRRKKKAAKRQREKGLSSDESVASLSSRGLDKFQRRWLQSFRELKKFRRDHGKLFPIFFVVPNTFC